MWREKNRDAWNKYQREYKKANGKYREQWDKVKADPNKLEKSRGWTTRYRNANRDKLNEVQRDFAQTLDDRWIARQIRNKYGLSRKVAKNMPDLIEAERLTQKIKRYVKQN